MNGLFRIATSNLQTGIGTTQGYWHYLATGWKYALPHGSRMIRKAGQFLEAAEIDIAAFCEIEGGSGRSKGVDQVELLVRESPLESGVFFPTYTVGERINQGNAVAARFPVRYVENHRLPGEGEPRFLSEAAVDLDGLAVRVFVTHLSLARDVRSQQISHIAGAIGHCEQPTILAGDFNVSVEDELDLMAQSNLTKAAGVETFPSWKPAKRLDYLFFSKHFRIREVYAFDRFLFSDHLPLVAEVRIQAG